MRRALSLLLVLALISAPLLTPARADEPLSLLPAVNDYADAGYGDVSADSWYAQAAQVCYETGLITGTQDGFAPTLTLTGGELAAIAARLREAIVGDAIGAPEGGSPWYAVYVSYLAGAGIDAPEPEAPASRARFVQLLAAVLPDSYTPAINAITALPDSGDEDVLRLYNAGILTGKDAYGTFDPAGTLTRAECAAMVARVVRPELRQSFTPEAPPETAALSYEEELLQTEALRVNGHAIPFSTFLDTLNNVIFKTDFSLAAQNGSRLDWDAKYDGVEDLSEYFLDRALEQTVEDYLVSYQAQRLGCAAADLPEALTPDPAAALDRIYRAKHILVADQATAEAIIQALVAEPTLERFDQLMAQYNQDPGMNSYPDGYLFTDGEMVAEFENAVKALRVNSFSTVPVQSDYGWHVILRLDPTTYPDWESAVRSILYESCVESWMNSATITPNTAELNKLDVRGRYEAYLEKLGMQ